MQRIKKDDPTTFRCRGAGLGPIAAIRVAALLLGAICLGCSSGEPFAYVPSSGKVTYEDGTLIPADGMVLTFFSQTPPKDAKTYPRNGVAPVDKATGEFTSVTTHKPKDGLVRGKHKVVLTASNGVLPVSIVPVEYRDPATTPLEVDASDQPIQLKIRKPR